MDFTGDAGFSDCASWYRARAAEPARIWPTLDRDLRTDVAIIGGGFAGLWSAVLLAEAGLSVALLEGGRVAGQASGRNGGFVSGGWLVSADRLVARMGARCGGHLYRLSLDGRDRVRAFLKDHPEIIQGEGKLKVVRHDDGGGLSDWGKGMNARHGTRFVPWDQERVRAALNSERYHAGLHDPDGFHVQPIDLAHALGAAAEAAGAAVFEQTPATRILPASRGWQVQTTNHVIAADRVILTTNVQSALLSPVLGRAILPVATYVVATNPMGQCLDDAIGFRGAVADTRRAGDYYRRVGDRLIWGGRMTTRTAEPSRLSQEMCRDIEAVYPQLADFSVSHCWTGLMGYTRHQMPVISELHPGLYGCTGFGGHGLNTCPAGAHAMSRAILGDRTELDLFAAFGPVWGGGMLGRAATQAEYWRRQMIDWWNERAA
jgi:gamma-glutamylputrescine oxidase